MTIFWIKSFIIVICGVLFLGHAAIIVPDNQRNRSEKKNNNLAANVQQGIAAGRAGRKEEKRMTTLEASVADTATAADTDAAIAGNDSNAGKQRAPTLPRNGVKIVFSDLDGTLVHFEKHFSPQGRILPTADEGTAASSGGGPATTTALYRNEQEGSPLYGQTRVCNLMPTLTMGPGLFSQRSSEIITRLREDFNVVFVYVTGARKSTILKRLPLLAPADYAVAETGGRMYKLVEPPPQPASSDTKQQQVPILDEEWTKTIEDALCGPIEGGDGAGNTPLEERKGPLWDWCRELVSRGVPCDTRDYTCCFRVDCKKKPGSDAIVRDAIRSSMPPGVSCAQNLGKYDFFPSVSGKGNAVAHLLDKLGIPRDDAVALFDDENDLPMAAACGHACVTRCTHDSIREHLPENPHWHLATETGVFATEQILEMLLENAKAAAAAANANAATP